MELAEELKKIQKKLDASTKKQKQLEKILQEFPKKHADSAGSFPQQTFGGQLFFE